MQNEQLLQKIKSIRNILTTKNKRYITIYKV